MTRQERLLYQQEHNDICGYGLTPDEIAYACDELEGTANRRAINEMFRCQDDSHLWPVRGRFNVTDRAIRQAQRWSRESGYDLCGLEYALFLDSSISRIVNDERNW